jgi:hypothetical protein
MSAAQKMVKFVVVEIERYVVPFAEGQLLPPLESVGVGVEEADVDVIVGVVLDVELKGDDNIGVGDGLELERISALTFLFIKYPRSIPSIVFVFSNHSKGDSSSYGTSSQ